MQEHHRTISVRDLSRRVAEVLDSVEMERQRLLVTRNGRPVATLMPLSSRPLDEHGPLVVVLSPTAEQILLRAASRAPQVTASFDDRGDWRDVSDALGRLEIDALIAPDFAGYRITEQGRLVAAILRARIGAD